MIGGREDMILREDWILRGDRILRADSTVTKKVPAVRQIGSQLPILGTYMTLLSRVVGGASKLKFYQTLEVVVQYYGSPFK